MSASSHLHVRSRAHKTDPPKSHCILHCSFPCRAHGCAPSHALQIVFVSYFLTFCHVVHLEYNCHTNTFLILPSFGFSPPSEGLGEASPPPHSGLYPKLLSSFCELRQSLSTLTKVSRYTFLSKNFSKVLRASVLTFFSATP